MYGVNMDPLATKEELELYLRAKVELDRALLRSLYHYVHIHGIKVRVDVLEVVSVGSDVEKGSVKFRGSDGSERCEVEFPLRFVYDIDYREELEIAAIEKLRREEIAAIKMEKAREADKERRERALYEALKEKFTPSEQ